MVTRNQSQDQSHLGVSSPAPGAAIAKSSCCPSTTAAQAQRRIDWMLWGSAALVLAGYLTHGLLGHDKASGSDHSMIMHYAAGTFELMNTMWWGILIGIVFVGLLDRVPRDVIIVALAGERRTTGLLRATAAGVLFDLCSHGVLMVGMKLYERGASIGQTVAFLLASPWNSLSLTIILISLIGWGYTIAFVLLSAVIAVITGWIFDALVAQGHLPENPARTDADVHNGGSLSSVIRTWLSDVRPSWQGFIAMLWDGLKGSRMVLRWLLFGVVLASLLRAVLPQDVFADWFGPTLFGVMMTVLAATIIEVCSEGAAPIGADLVTRASAPGNGFTFLMAGVATDYTEVMSLKDTTGSWKIALALPIIAVPQVLAIGVMLNHLA